jgi:hypothetical protein
VKGQCICVTEQSSPNCSTSLHNLLDGYYDFYQIVSLSLELLLIGFGFMLIDMYSTLGTKIEMPPKIAIVTIMILNGGTSFPVKR